MNLKLPKFDVKIIRSLEGMLQVYDKLRKKYVALTPEEWVRQHFVNYLTIYKGYPCCFMANEVGLRHNDVSRRCDTVVYDKSAQPLVIIEYKASTVKITAKVFDQIVRYNMALQVKWLMVSNGIDSYCCEVMHDGKYRFLKEIPAYSQL